MTDPTKMTPAELDSAIAREVMGWTLDQDSDVWISGADAMETAKDYHPSSNISDAFAAEEEIERRKLDLEYARNLYLAKAAMMSSIAQQWLRLIRASPADRCRSLLKTVRAAKEGQSDEPR